MFKALAGIQRHIALTLALPLLIGFPQAATAQEEEKLAKIQELMEILQVAERADNFLKVFVKQNQEQVESANPGLEDVAAELMREKVLPAMRGRLPEYLEIVTELYAEEFTLAELEQTVAFYSSPTGRKWMQIEPRLRGYREQIALQWGSRISGQVMREFEADFQKRGLAMPPI